MSAWIPRPAANRGPRAWQLAGSGRPPDGAIDHLASLLVALGMGLWTARRHLAWAAADHGLPVGDAPGHVIIAMRWWLWWTGSQAFPPNEPFPPLVYLSLLWARLTQGDSFDALQVAMAAWAGLLVGGAAWAAARGGGGSVGALLAGLLLLRAPQLHDVARQFLLDGPATAMLILTLGAAWWSDGFRRPGPALLAGLLGGGLVVVKYSLLVWLLAPVLLWAGGMVLRRPAALLPLLLTAAHLAFWGERLWARRLLRIQVELPTAELVWLGIAAVGIAAAGIVARVPLLARLRHGPGSEGLRRGVGASLAAHGALAVAMTWLWWGAQPTWEKVQREAIAEVRSAGWRLASDMGLANLSEGLPLAGWGLVAALVAIGLAACCGDRPRARRSLGALVQALAAALVGTWLLSRSLPVDPKYYVPIAPLAAVGLAAGLGAHRLTRGILAPLACLALALQILWVDALPTRETSTPWRHRAEVLLWRLPATWTEARAPVTEDWEAACQQVVRAAVEAWPAEPPKDCAGYVISSPRLRVVEDRAFMAQATLLGLSDERWTRPQVGMPLCGGISVQHASEEAAQRLARQPHPDGADQGWGGPLPEGARLLQEASPTPEVRVLSWQAPTP